MSTQEDRSMVLDRFTGAARRALDGLSPTTAVSRTYEHWIRRREQALHEETTNRVSLPFEWGPEHLGLDSVAALDDVVRRSLADSDALFSAGPRFEGPYDFDGTLLRFPSPCTSQYPINDTVVGRFFPGRFTGALPRLVTRAFTRERARRLAVIVTPEWTASWDSHVTFCQILAAFGIAALRLSAPYHHARMPLDIERPEYLCSANIGRTLAAVRQGVLDVRRAADWLELQGYERIAVLGTSAGSLISFLAFAHDPRLSLGTFLMLSSSFADVVWRGLSTEHVRASLTGHVTLDALRHYWGPLSPLSHVKRLAGGDRSTLFISGQYDPTCPPELTQVLYDALAANDARHQKLWLPCGHHTMATFPFSLIVTLRVLTFMLGIRP